MTAQFTMHERTGVGTLAQNTDKYQTRREYFYFFFFLSDSNFKRNFFNPLDVKTPTSSLDLFDV